MTIKKIKSDVAFETLANDASGRVPQLDEFGNLGNSSITISELASLPNKIDVSTKDVANGVAGLDASGKILGSTLPALSITNVYTVGDMQALDGFPVGPADGEVQEGDVVVVTNGGAVSPFTTMNINNGDDFDITAAPAGTAQNGATIQLIVLAAAANAGGAILMDWTGSAAALVLTVTPDSGSSVSADELVEYLNSGAITAKTVTETQPELKVSIESAAGGGAIALLPADGATGTMVGGYDSDIVGNGQASYIYDGSGYIFLKSQDSVQDVNGQIGSVFLDAANLQMDQAETGDWTIGDTSPIKDHLDELAARAVALEAISTAPVAGDARGYEEVASDGTFNVIALLIPVTTFGFDLNISVETSAGVEMFRLLGANQNTSTGDFSMVSESVGAVTGVSFTITAAGQIQCTSGDLSTNPVGCRYDLKVYS